LFGAAKYPNPDCTAWQVVMHGGGDPGDAPGGGQGSQWGLSLVFAQSFGMTQHWPRL